jgi:hypothetical protein
MPCLGWPRLFLTCNLDALKRPIHKLNHRVWRHLCKAWVSIFRFLDTSHIAAITEYPSPLPTPFPRPSRIIESRVMEMTSALLIRSDDHETHQYHMGYPHFLVPGYGAIVYPDLLVMEPRARGFSLWAGPYQAIEAGYLSAHLRGLSERDREFPLRLRFRLSTKPYCGSFVLPWTRH